MTILEEIHENLKNFKKIYDTIRIIDPLHKKVLLIDDDIISPPIDTCYSFWKKSSACKNCVSIRARHHEDTFYKIEYIDDSVYLITASPYEYKGKVYIIEMLKNISVNGTVTNKSYKLNEIEHTLTEVTKEFLLDPLTNVYNRKFMYERLLSDINENLINNTPLSLIMADIDFFKKINDSYGHLIGDKVLHFFANILKNHFNKDSYWIARYGGEEFLIALNNTSLDEAYKLCEDLRIYIENLNIKIDSLTINLTCSFGMYTLNNELLDVDNAIKKVDKNLYSAKNLGRNTIFYDKSKQV